jgi:hypothetical protein
LSSYIKQDEDENFPMKGDGASEIPRESHMEPDIIKGTLVNEAVVLSKDQNNSIVTSS